ncbi:MAG: hypothetical protein GX951_03520 [Mollicutes bacterium]|nr:hypothetical protein [Mollicutes bacterium]
MKIGVISGISYAWDPTVDEYFKCISDSYGHLPMELIISFVDSKGNLNTGIVYEKFFSKPHYFGEVIKFNEETGEVFSLDESPKDVYGYGDFRPFTDDEKKQVLVLIEVYQKMLRTYKGLRRKVDDDIELYHVDLGVTPEDVNNNWEKYKTLKAKRDDDLEFNKLLDYKIREIEEVLLIKLATILEKRAETEEEKTTARIRLDSFYKKFKHYGK